MKDKEKIKVFFFPFDTNSVMQVMAAADQECRGSSFSPLALRGW